VFVDYNQNARDRTVASAYSVRPTPDARVSCALAWDEVADVEPRELRLDTVPDRLRERGDPAATSTSTPARLAKLLDLAQRDEEEGLATRPGRRTSASRRTSRSASSPAATAIARSRAASATAAARPRRTRADRAGPGAGPPATAERRTPGQGYDEEFEDA